MILVQDNQELVTVGDTARLLRVSTATSSSSGPPARRTRNRAAMPPRSLPCPPNRGKAYLALVGLRPRMPQVALWWEAP